MINEYGKDVLDLHKLSDCVLLEHVQLTKGLRYMYSVIRVWCMLLDFIPVKSIEPSYVYFLHVHSTCLTRYCTTVCTSLCRIVMQRLV